ncbi:hypothetical protein GS597_04940 [Synechococcales cyanobacterium C]|uniref:Phosphate-starvation-inducible PsiE family protein n=2 Tax=Petrachloros TaxID=2918834 RepID=A0A8K1ZXG5_9CYAN|nr:hypothetical protein [Petrachloros mirabilis ULC683]
MGWKHRRRQLMQLFTQDEQYLKMLKALEALIAKVLSLALMGVILASVVDLMILLIKDLLAQPYGLLETTLLELFGLFLNILIALELLENITAYLSKHGVQVSLVVATALIAVARKLIIFDFSTASSNMLTGLAIAIFSLSVSYWLIKAPSREA